MPVISSTQVLTSPVRMSNQCEMSVPAASCTRKRKHRQLKKKKESKRWQVCAVRCPCDG